MDNAAIQMAVEGLKRQYFHGVDSKDWKHFGAAFADDAVMDMSAATNPPAPPLHGRGAIVAFVRSTLDGITTIHRGFLRTLESPAPGRAKALWAMEDILFTGESGQLRKMLHAYGHYHEEYRLVGERWLYSKVRLTRTYVETF